jgi:hypothetical protein
VKIPARAPLTKQAQRTRVSPGPQVPQRGLAHEVGALGTQPGRATASLADARTVDYSPARDSMQSVDAPSSMSERFVTDGHLRPSGRIDARTSAMRVSPPGVADHPTLPSGQTDRRRWEWGLNGRARPGMGGRCHHCAAEPGLLMVAWKADRCANHPPAPRITGGTSHCV